MGPSTYATVFDTLTRRPTLVSLGLTLRTSLVFLVDPPTHFSTNITVYDTVRYMIHLNWGTQGVSNTVTRLYSCS